MRLFTFGSLAVVLCGCSTGLNLFSLADDIELGAQVHAEILSDPTTYPILDPLDYPEAYDHLYRIRDDVLAAQEVRYEDDFEWEVHWIADDEVLNAFAVPGGYLYLYTGLAKYLDAEDHFAGVMGHEIAHADRRHSTQKMTEVYGIQTLLGIVLGDDAQAAQDIAAGLAALSFSRAHESDADEYSVAYLCDTGWAADGAAAFFEKLEANQEGASVPAFLTTHPNPANRVAAIEEEALNRGCETSESAAADWEAVLDTLP